MSVIHSTDIVPVNEDLHRIIIGLSCIVRQKGPLLTVQGNLLAEIELMFSLVFNHLNIKITGFFGWTARAGKPNKHVCR